MVCDNHFICCATKPCRQIKTGYGDSTPVYGNDTVPIAGMEQGNELRPSLWALISKIIINMCKKKGHSITITINYKDRAISG